jgi:hypothetical protein
MNTDAFADVQKLVALAFVAQARVFGCANYPGYV